MIDALGTPQIRSLERTALESGAPLMKNAAYAIAMRSQQLLRAGAGAVAGARVVMLVGAGNNGGDGLYAAVRLAGLGVHVQLIRTSGRVHADGMAAARAQRIPVRTLATTSSTENIGDDDIAPVSLPQAVAMCLEADQIIDAMLGIGASGALRDPAATLVRRLNQRLQQPSQRGRRPHVIAVDVPSGIGVDDGRVPGPVLTADVTLGCGALAAGLLLPPASFHAPHVELLDIGMGHASADGALREPSGEGGVITRIEDHDVPVLLRQPEHGDDKYRRGVVGIVAGTTAFPGAAVLSCSAAVQSGAGMVRYLGPDHVAASVIASFPEVVPGPGRVQAWVLGPGVDPDDEQQRRHIESALADAGVGSQSRFGSSGVWGAKVADPSINPVVVDAGALTFITENCPPWVVLTPHAGELARLLTAWGENVSREEVEAAPYEYARRAHELIGATVLLKGSTTIVVGRGVVFSQAEAPNWLATAGAGDVLAGLLGSLLAGRSHDALQDPAVVAEQAALAALIHGRAAHHANPGGPVTSVGVADALGVTIARLLASS